MTICLAVLFLTSVVIGDVNKNCIETCFAWQDFFGFPCGNKFATAGQAPHKGYGAGGGHNYRADSAIALCLSNWPECVHTSMLRGNGLQVENIKASGEQMGIYRWIGTV